VQSVRLGVVGSLNSGKTPLIHRYLTGGYRTQETSEGGRFKKDIVMDGKCHLLLIRDEGEHPPDLLFTHWLDGVLIVFSVTNRESYIVAMHFLQVMADFRAQCDFPVIIVGTQDSISPSNPRVVSDEEAKKYANQWNCRYAEVCSTTGSKVENVFRAGEFNYSRTLRVFSFKVRATQKTIIMLLN
jgi:Arf-GAP/GTPase/ANK repeat/PH domain-containing protein 1/3